MWNKIKTKIANALGFWTSEQIGGQYTPVFEHWRYEHDGWMKVYGLEPLTYDPSITITVNGTLGTADEDQIRDAVQKALDARHARRKKIASDYLDGNDNWKKKTNVD